MSEYLIIGDIEDGIHSYEDAIEAIDNRGKKKIIFLGDIYTPRSSSLCIKRLETILNKFGYEIPEVITEFKTINDCKLAISKFEELYQYKCIDIYTYNDRFKRELPTSSIILSDIVSSKMTSDEGIFLFGNKEVEILRDFHSIKGINIIDGYAVFSYQYSFKHKTHENVLRYSPHDVNVLLMYFSLCRHVFYVYNTLITHIYINSRTLTQMKIGGLDIRQTICGHNRCFGKYRDNANPFISIYIIDISHEEEHLLKNYIRLRPNEITFFSLNPEASDTLKHTMSANRTFLMSFDDVGHSVGAIAFRRAQLETIKNGYNDKH